MPIHPDILDAFGYTPYVHTVFAPYKTMKPNVHQFPEQADPATLLQYKIAVMQAYADGAKLEMRSRYNSAAPWGPATTPPAFDWLNYRYRIAPPKLAAGRNRSGLTEDEVGVKDGWRLLTEEEHLPRRQVESIQYRQRDGTWSHTDAWYTTYEDLRTQKPAGYFLPKAPAKPTTVLGWLCTLPEGYKQRAVQNLENDRVSNPATSLGAALGDAFIWRKSPEGYAFWSEVSDWVVGIACLPPLPALPAEKPTDEQAFEDWFEDVVAPGGQLMRDLRPSFKLAYDAGVRHGRTTS